MIDIKRALAALPHFEKFCSVGELNELVQRVSGDTRFDIRVPGTSVGGIPIHHVRYGSGAVKALFVAGPHCPEPIGSLTVYSLLTLLKQGCRALLNADVEWHIVPCIDPDGALLNEGWTAKSFSPENYMRHFFVQPYREQVDFSFPIADRKLNFTELSKEAKVLQTLLDQIQPDFFYTLHNTQLPAGGTWYAISSDIGKRWYRELVGLLEQHDLPLQAKTAASTWFTQFAPGISAMPTVRKYYDFLEEQGLEVPDYLLNGTMGASSYDYLGDIRPDAISFCIELPYLMHPSDGSSRPTQYNLLGLMLRIIADNRLLASAILEEWRRVETALDSSSALYRKIDIELVTLQQRLEAGGAAMSWGTLMQSPQALLSADEDRPATEAELFFTCMAGRFLFLCHAYCFVRLLRQSKQTEQVTRAIERFDGAFAGALAAIMRTIDFKAFELIPCDTLASVQLGSGLVVLNSMLEKQKTASRLAGK